MEDCLQCLFILIYAGDAHTTISARDSINDARTRNITLEAVGIKAGRNYVYLPPVAKIKVVLVVPSTTNFFI